jgi:hypothetical protein
MRSRHAITLAALVATLVLGAIASASASAALPEFTPGPGWSFPITDHYTFGSSEWRSSSRSWLCTSGSMSGEIAGAKSMTSETITFVGCRSGLVACKSEGAGPEEIKTQLLAGKPLYREKTAKTTGILFSPASGTALAKIFCTPGINATLEGTVVMPITPVNVLSESFGLEVDPSLTGYETEKGGKTHAEMKFNTGSGTPTMTWKFNGTFLTQRPVEIKA